MAKQQPAQGARRQAPQPSEPRRQAPAAPVREKSTGASDRFNLGSNELIYGRENFILMGAGLGLIFLGLFLMSGGQQPDPNQWDESIIYSPLRITVAPILMLAGFLLEIYAIFKKPKKAAQAAEPVA